MTKTYAPQDVLATHQLWRRDFARSERLSEAFGHLLLYDEGRFESLLVTLFGPAGGSKKFSERSAESPMEVLKTSSEGWEPGKAPEEESSPDLPRSFSNIADRSL
ncbi:hypothetical protein CROQUDRAFT_93638 [Cronartium quercuum f. sp. fusiforme G11]|uniref:Uncharacterized protein n=1 Tax=Cronartium quercuum f. sp. fusiforme G11 TaxID=708437 RepID=A0A9P6NKE2_9BASI|nr:hypothetical protein CROQUDRAFT_93638 [Cronartium quercuum f. sp. fusiforme G11]